MNKSRLILVELLHELIAFFTLHAIFSIQGFSYLGVIWWQVMPLFFIAFCTIFIIRRKTKYLISFTIAHGILFIPLMFLEKTKWIYFFFVLGIIIHSFSVRIRGVEKRNTIYSIAPVLVICFLEFIFNSYLDLQIPRHYLIGISIAAVATCILIEHIINIDNTMQNMQTIGNQPIGSVLRFNNVIIILFILLIVVVGVLAQWFPIDKIIFGLLNIVFSIMRFIVSLFSKEPREEPLILRQESEPMGNPMGFFEESETGIIWIIFEKIILFLMPIVVIAGAIFAVVYIIYTIYKKFYASNIDGIDTKEFISPVSIIEKEKRGTKKRAALFFARSKEEKIRREFYRKVKGYINKGMELEDSNTPKNIADKINEYEDINELTEAYEKARYSK